MTRGLETVYFNLDFEMQQLFSLRVCVGPANTSCYLGLC